MPDARDADEVLDEVRRHRAELDAKADELWRAAQGSAGDGEAGPAEAESSPWGWQALARTLGVQAG